MKTEVCLYGRHVTQELTLWLVGSIGGNANPPAGIQPDNSLEVVLPTPLLTPNEIEHEATNGTASPEPQPPSLSECPSPNPLSRGEPTAVSHSRKVQPGDVGDIRAGRLSSNAQRIEYAPGGYVSCSTGTFAGRTIRAEVIEVQKANVGRKCVCLSRHGCHSTRAAFTFFLETKRHPTSS